MAEKGIVIINHSRNPFTVKDLEGKEVALPIDGSVEVSKEEAAKLLKYRGMVDASKYVKPTSVEEDLRKKNAALEKELADLKAKSK